MNPIIFILLSFLVTAIVVAPIIFIRSRKILREQKNYERGLKMIPLLIHLPPSSDDKESGARDERELVDENISKAQILYTIIASTLQKGVRQKFYGQRHFAFEIIATHGFVKFYAAVPVTLVEVVKQAVISAYPAARLEEVAEHNIFNPIGRISGALGGELTLKEPFAYPIATYQDIKRDPMQSLLNALSTLQKEDGVGIQILMRPADKSWRKTATDIASKKRKGKKDKKPYQMATGYFRTMIFALWQPPEEKDKESSPDSGLSNLDQTVLDAIDDKTRHAGYETLIRVVASSNVSQRSQAILSNVVAAFALYDAPGKNGFKFTPAQDIEQFVTSFILRFFPQQSNQDILNAVELATIFHFPDQKNIPTSQLERQNSKQVDGPRNIPDKGLFIGYNIFRGVKKAVRISLLDRQRHIYAVGQTGTGKSTFMENLAYQDMLNGDGFAFIDPHGDVAERLLSMVPKERTEDVIYFCPSDMDYPLGLNMFEYQTSQEKDFLVQEAINMLYKLYDPQHQGIIGPRYEHWFRMAALTVMSNPEGGTFIDVPKVFTDKQYEQQLKKHVKDQTVLDFWNKEMAATSDYHKSEVLGWFVSKFGAFLANEMMRNIIGQSKSSFNMREVMDNKKILIVNLSKGKSGELNSKLLGMIFVMKFQAAAMSRADIEEDERVDFCLYVDEFQNFSTDSFAQIMSEARKYHLNLVVANQFTTQLTEEIRDAVFGNMGTIVSFRVGQNDVDILSKYFQPLFDQDDLLRVPNHNAIVRTLIGGVPTQPFSMATVPPLGVPNEKLGTALKQLSAAKYGRPRAKVDAAIFARMATPDAPLPAQALPGSNQQSPAPPRSGVPPQRPGAKPSFLDDWLAKKNKAPVNSGAPRSGQPAAMSAPVPQAQPQPYSGGSPYSPASNTSQTAVYQQPQTTTPSPVAMPSGTNVQYEPSVASPQPLRKVDQEKVQSAAEELTKGLGQKNGAQASSTDGVQVRLHSNPDEQSDEDTIYIDREGTLLHKEDISNPSE